MCWSWEVCWYVGFPGKGLPWMRRLPGGAYYIGAPSAGLEFRREVVVFWLLSHPLPQCLHKQYPGILPLILAALPPLRDEVYICRVWPLWLLFLLLWSAILTDEFDPTSPLCPFVFILGYCFLISVSCQCRRVQCVFNLWVRKVPWRRKWQPTPVFLPGKFHDRSLVGLQSLRLQKSRTWLSN